jgi:hypothetical protein
MSKIYDLTGTRNTYRALDRYRVIPHLHTFELRFPPTIRAFEDLQAARIRPLPIRGAQGSVWGYRTKHNRPTRKQILALERLARKHRAAIIRSDIAFDILVPTPNIQRVHEVARQTAILKGRKNGRMHDEENGTYFNWRGHGKAPPPRDLALYSDRINQHTGRKCVHLELRFFRSYVVKKQGIRYLRDLLTINPQKLFLRHVKFSVLGIENANRVIRREIRKERQKHAQRKNRSDHPVLDQYRNSLPRRIEHILARTGNDRAQNVWDRSPAIRRTGRRKDIPPIFDIPTCLTWQEDQRVDHSAYAYSDTAFIEIIGEFQNHLHEDRVYTKKEDRRA